MKVFIKHIILLFALLISFYQAAHIFAHACSEHDSDNKELVQLTDHKCNLCSNHINFIVPNLEYELLSFIEKKSFEQKFTFVQHFKNYKPILFAQLRAPPTLILL